MREIYIGSRSHELPRYSITDITGRAKAGLEIQGDNFRRMHPREEYDIASDRRIKAIQRNYAAKLPKDEIYGADIQKLYGDICVILRETYNCKESELGLPRVIRSENSEECLARLSVLSKILKTRTELDRDFFEEMYRIFSDYEIIKSGKDYMRRLVFRRLRTISPELIPCGTENTLSTRLLILKQFIKQFGWCEGVPDSDRSGRGFECERLRKIIGQKSFDEAACDITEDVFSELTEIKDNRGNLKAGKNYNNLRLVNVAKNLGEGFHRKKNNTAEDLYVFAVAFEMTFSPDPPSPNSPEYYTDIEKNLFFDYYTENMLDRIGLDDKQRDKAENYITGYGINFKSYLDVSYLYAILKNAPDALTRLKEARRNIEFFRKEANKAKTKAKTIWQIDDELSAMGLDRGRAVTKLYIERIRMLDDMDTNEFRSFILRNYETRADYDMLLLRDNIKWYEFGTEQRTAAAVYGALTQSDIRDKNNEHKWIDCFDSWSFPAGDDEGRKRFVRFIERFNELVKRERRLRTFDITDDIIYPATPGNFADGRNPYGDIIITRFSLITAALDYLLCVSRGDTEDDLDNFGAYYEYITDYAVFRLPLLDGTDGYRTYMGLDDLLLDCGYMEVSPKNIFDVMLIYASYRKNDG